MHHDQQQQQHTTQQQIIQQHRHLRPQIPPAEDHGILIPEGVKHLAHQIDPNEKLDSDVMDVS
jgi:hypothetical protein